MERMNHPTGGRPSLQVTRVNRLGRAVPDRHDRVDPNEKGLQDLLLEAAGEIPAVGGVVKAAGFTAALEREEQTKLARRG